MDPVAFSLRLHGEAVELGTGRFWVESRGVPGAGERWSGGLADLGAASAVCRRDLEIRADGSLVQHGELTFGPHDAITFRAHGTLGGSPDPGRRHGTAVLEVTGGRGGLAGARGFVTSNFLLAATGELDDHQFGLLFVERPS